MPFRRIALMCMVLLLASVLPLPAGPPRGKPVHPLQQWSGSVDDLSLLTGMPEVTTSTAALEMLWQAWQVPHPLPRVNFSRELVVVATTRGSILRFGAVLDDQGDLRVRSVSTKDLRPGFRYVIAVVSREGVKTVNGKDL